MKLNTALSILLLTLSVANPSSAAIIDSNDVNGLTTFQDTSTKRIWLDMDNFFSPATGGKIGLEMIAAAQAAGFTVANRTDVTALLSGIALGANFSNAAPIMGYGASRQLIWGMYDDGANPSLYGWAYAYKGVSDWAMSDATYDPSTLVNAGVNTSQDLGIFAFRESAAAEVPEPGSTVLLGLGIAGLLAARRRKAA